MSSKTKSFMSDIDAAMQFISQPEREQPENVSELPTPEDCNATNGIGVPPVGYKANLQFIEKKTRRVNVLMQPSLYDKLSAKANSDGLSVNELINVLLADAIDSKGGV